MMRLTDDEKRIGPVRWGTTTWKAWRLVVSSHGGDEGDEWNTLTAYLRGLIVSVYLPRIIQPQRRKVQALSWSAETVLRMGRDWYWDEEPREYGFSLSEGMLAIYYGIHPGDSRRDQVWTWFLPWTQWRFVRFSLYNPDGSHFWTQMDSERRRGIDAFTEQLEATDRVPKVQFSIRDFDGEAITATTHVEEREWHFGTGWFAWLSWFRKARIRRSLDIRYSAEVGREKGSWKGGTVGTGVEMLPGETPKSAFMRFCSEPHRSKSGRYTITFVGEKQRGERDD